MNPPHLTGPAPHACRISPEARARGLAKASAAKRANRAQWAALHLRQQWADGPWMRAHLRAAGVTVADDAEPATVPRLAAKLRQAGLTLTDARAAVGLTLAEYLRRNPDLPLWAALALVLEAEGTYTAQAAAIRQSEPAPKQEAKRFSGAQATPLVSCPVNS